MKIIFLKWPLFTWGSSDYFSDLAQTLNVLRNQVTPHIPLYKVFMLISRHQICRLIFLQLCPLITRLAPQIEIFLAFGIWMAAHSEMTGIPSRVPGASCRVLPEFGSKLTVTLRVISGCGWWMEACIQKPATTSVHFCFIVSNGTEGWLQVAIIINYRVKQKAGKESIRDTAHKPLRATDVIHIPIQAWDFFSVLYFIL